MKSDSSFPLLFRFILDGPHPHPVYLAPIPCFVQVALLGPSQHRVVCATDSKTVRAMVRVTDARDLPVSGAEVHNFETV